MLEEREWFPRLGDVPGVSHPGSPRVNRAALPEAAIVPVRNASGWTDSDLLYWPTTEGWSSAPPASEAASGEWQGTSDELLLRLEKVLELPGYASSYHFAIQNCCEVLWKRRRSEPELLARLEALFWLDVRLVRARPDPFRLGTATSGPGFVMMHSFRRLFSVYLTEGFVPEALEVAELCAQFGQGEESRALASALAAREAREGR